MFKLTILLLLSFLLSASAFNASLTKSFSLITNGNQLSYKFLHTQNGVITYNVRSTSSAEIPEYHLFDLQTGNITQILSDTISDCHKTDEAVFSRLHYHIPTSTLVYYCASNNSLLLLDKQDYSVKNSIQTHVNQTFAEVQISTNKLTVFILGTGELYSTSQPAILIQINILTKKVINTVTLNKNSYEAVLAFASKNQDAYLTTYNITNTTIVLSINAMNLTQGSYELTPIIRFRFVTGGSRGPINQLYCVGDFVVFNRGDSLLFVTKEGQMAHTFSPLAIKSLTEDSSSWINAAFVRHEEDQRIYALLANQTLLSISINGSDYTLEQTGKASDMAVAVGNYFVSDLLFTVSHDEQLLNITNSKNSQTVYTTVGLFDDLMITNTTYCAIETNYHELSYLYIFYLNTNLLIANISISASYYYDKEQQILYFLDSSQNRCQLTQIDLQTGYNTSNTKFDDPATCQGEIIQLKMSDVKPYPYLVIAKNDNSFVIVNSYSGVTVFNPPVNGSNNAQIAVLDYNTYGLYYLISSNNGENSNISYYQLDHSSNKYILQGTDTISNIAVDYYYSIGDRKVAAVSATGCTIIDLNTSSTSNFTFSFSETPIVSDFQDRSGNDYLLFSEEASWENEDNIAVVLGPQGISQLEGVGNTTVQSGAAGDCSYWVMDGFLLNFGTVRFYDICSKDDLSLIYA